MMTSTRSAAALGLPVEPAPLHRRGFLRQLAALPLVGGSVTLIGQPQAVAEPVTEALMWGYKDWLFYEHRMLSHELVGYASTEQARYVERTSRRDGDFPAADWHFNFPYHEGSILAGWPEAPQPSTRAALVLSAVGCDWRPRASR